MFQRFMHRGCEGHAAAREAGERGFGGGDGFGAGGFGGRGGPFGRHRGGPFAGRGARMFDPGALRLVVLGLIADEPRHGYDIIKAFETRFQGTYSPSPGAIYPMLQMLEEADLVVSAATGNKRLYTVTEGGRAYLDEQRAELDRINAQLNEFSGELRDNAVGEALHALRRTLRDKLRHGTLDAERSGRLRALLDRVRQDIEAL